MRYRCIAVGTPGSEGRLVDSIESLPRVVFFEETPSGPLALKFIPAGRDVYGRVYGLVFFGAVIDPIAPRRWWTSYDLPEAWNDLRNGRPDICEYRIFEGQEVPRLVMSITFPRGTGRPVIEPEPGTPAADVQWSSDAYGRWVATLELLNPPPGCYAWTLRLGTDGIMGRTA
jgi:hypothetical protein